MMPALDPDFAAPAEWAALYREHGLQVVPAYYPEEHPDNWKRPAIKTWREFTGELVDDALFRRWYGPGGEHAARRNMGIITGACSDDVFVLDLDDHATAKAGEWWQGLLEVENYGQEPETWQQVTGGGGRQLLFRAPAGWSPPTNKTTHGIDIRGQGGFAIMPSSRHSSGQYYRWKEGCGPKECDIAKAPAWLTDAIDKLVGERGVSVVPRFDVPTQEGAFNGFGRLIDGREHYMARLIWAAAVSHYAECLIFSSADSDAARDDAYAIYERKVVINVPGKPERGYREFCHKWRSTMKKWGGELGEAAAARPKEKSSPFLEEKKTSGPIKTFDFARLMLETVEEQPALIEPDLLDYGGFLLIGGPPKAQKSWLLQDVLVSCAIGVPFLGEMFKADRPLKIFWLQAEMNEKLLRRRAKTVQGLTDEQIDMLASNLIVSDRFRMVLGEDGVRLAAELIKASFHDGPPDIIAFDPLANIYDQENENDNAQMMRFLTQRLEAVRQLVNPVAGVILVHHATKKSPHEIAKDPFNCFRGGGALRGHYDSGIIIFKKSEEGAERELHFELRGGEAPEPATVKLQQGRMQPVKNSIFFEPQKGLPDRDTCNLILAAIETAWLKKDPWSTVPQTRRTGRYAPSIIAENYRGVSAKAATILLEKWLMNGILIEEQVSSDTKKRGLKALVSRL